MPTRRTPSNGGVGNGEGPDLTSPASRFDLKRHFLSHQTFKGPEDFDRAIHDVVTKLNAERHRDPLGSQQIVLSLIHRPGDETSLQVTGGTALITFPLINIILAVQPRRTALSVYEPTPLQAAKTSEAGRPPGSVPWT